MLLSGAAAIAIILFLYLTGRFSKSDNPFFFYDMAIFALSGFLLVTGIVLLILRLIGKFNVDLGIITFAFSVVITVAMLISYSQGMSVVYYVVLFSNIFVIVTVGPIFYFLLKQKE